MRQATRVSLAAIISLAALAPAAHAADAVSDADRAFIAMVSQGGMFEVQLGTVAAEKGSAQDIKDQGAMEVHDHQLVGEKLKTIAAAADITFPATLNAEFQKKLDALNAMSGLAFDKAYLAAMKDIHAKDGAAFAKEAKGGTNPKLKAFAAETHRIVERHIGGIAALPAGM